VFWWQLIFCGNGGSTAVASTSRLSLSAAWGQGLSVADGWPAIALTTNTSVLTSVGNDYGFEDVFSPRQGL
jgi:phosphoheptose isomerase